MELEYINEDNFTKKLNEKEITIVAFSTEWCEPCAKVAYLFEKLSPKFPLINFFEIDIDENPNLAHRFSVIIVPIIVFFKNGKQIDNHIGIINRDDLLKKIEKLTKK